MIGGIENYGDFFRLTGFPVGGIASKVDSLWWTK